VRLVISDAHEGQSTHICHRHESEAVGDLELALARVMAKGPPISTSEASALRPRRSESAPLPSMLPRPFEGHHYLIRPATMRWLQPLQSS
jgi:hypothetical protein